MGSETLRIAKIIVAAKGPSDLPARIVQAHKLSFPGQEDTLAFHLRLLNVPELTNYLAWIPFERFESITKLGQGGFATVWKGTVRWGRKEHARFQWSGSRPNLVEIVYDRRPTEIDYALKEIDASMAAELLLNAYLSYNRSLAAITMAVVGISQHIVTGKYLMVMECADGSMERLCQIPLDSNFWSVVLNKSLILARRLLELFRLGVIHHDLHPGNIVYHQDSVYIIDIGLAVPIGRHYSSDGVYGRLAYMPPEIFEKQPYTAKSDVYCFATLVWQMITGVPPKGNAGALRADGMREELVPGMPPELEKLIRDCWNVNPEKRPGVDEIRMRLNRLISDATRIVVSAETQAYVLERRGRYAAQNSSTDVSGADSSAVSKSDASIASSNLIGNSSRARSSRFYSHEELEHMKVKTTA